MKDNQRSSHTSSRGEQLDDLAVSTTLHRLWVLNVLAIALTSLMYLDNISVIIRICTVGLIPFLLQFNAVFNDKNNANSKVYAKVAFGGTLAGSLIGVIFLLTVFVSWVRLQLSYQESHMKVWAPASIVWTWHLMHTIESAWQIFGQVLALTSNAVFLLCHEHESHSKRLRRARKGVKAKESPKVEMRDRSDFA